jgi:tRNA 2-thiocytidine biosynthesis protein TtcA
VKGNLLHALAHVVPSHLLDRDLHRALAQATGKDPWLDGDEEECEPEGVVKLASE